MTPKLPRFWFLWPLAVTTIFLISLTIALTGVSVHDTRSTTGIFMAERVPSQHAQYLGYVRDETNPSWPHMVTNGIAFHRYDDEHLSYEFTFVPPFSIMDHQLVTTWSISLDTKVGRYYTLSIVYPIGPIIKNSFVFSPADGSAENVTYNFYKLVVGADLKTTSVYPEWNSEPQIFTNGNWSYRSVDNTPIMAYDGVAGYTTRNGFGSVCTTINADCSQTNVELKASPSDSWAYYPSYQHEIIIAP
jgi:hypothetical protein